MNSTGKERKPILLYDSECTLCVRFKKALELIDLKKTVVYKSIYETSIYIDYPELSQEECERIIHLIASDGKIYVGAEVIEFLLVRFPGVKKFSWLLEGDSTKKAFKVFYKQINDMRMMKKKNCYSCGKGKKK